MAATKPPIVAKAVGRIIRYNGEVLADFNPDNPDVHEIVRMHMAVNPELATANVDGPTYEDGKAVYIVTTRRGDKG